jgi:hypothetical protein
MRSNRFLKWMATTLTGHMVLYMLAMSIVPIPVFMYLNYSQGTLTFTWATFIVIIGLIAGAALGVFCWYTIQLPFINRRNGKF